MRSLSMVVALILCCAARAQDAAPLTAEQERALKPGDVLKECASCPEMVVVPAGSFTMGSPADEKDRDRHETQHLVKIARPFAVGRFHVTRDQFAAFVSDTGYKAASECFKFGSHGDYTGSWRDPGFAQEGSHPVVCVSFDDARAYVGWLANTTAKPYRLLSEAEWEYAARGQTTPGRYPHVWFGDDAGTVCANANSRASLCSDGYQQTSPVGHYAANPFGLFDMAGNAQQWTADCWHDDYSGAPADGSAWTLACSGTGHVVRGGSWSDQPGALRAADRLTFSTADGTVGFRVARALPPSEPPAAPEVQKHRRGAGSGHAGGGHAPLKRPTPNPDVPLFLRPSR